MCRWCCGLWQERKCDSYTPDTVVRNKICWVRVSLAERHFTHRKINVKWLKVWYVSQFLSNITQNCLNKFKIRKQCNYLHESKDFWVYVQYSFPLRRTKNFPSAKLLLKKTSTVVVSVLWCTLIRNIYTDGSHHNECLGNSLTSPSMYTSMVLEFHPL